MFTFMVTVMSRFPISCSLYVSISRGPFRLSRIMSEGKDPSSQIETDVIEKFKYSLLPLEIKI